jgi:prevent-host-death family protein
MTKVGSRELKNRMGKYLREVKAGRSVLITERGEHIGTINPKPKTEKNETFDELLDQLEKQGLIRRGRGKLPKFKAVKSRGGKLASEIIIEDRK